jgi:integrase/transposase-like protein
VVEEKRLEPLTVESENQDTSLGSGQRHPAALHSSDTTTIQCPECGSQRVWKDGMRYEPYGEIQRYLCRNCYYRFSHKSEGSQDSEYHQKIQRQILSRTHDTASSSQVCVSQTKAMINLASVETRTQEKVAGATTDQATIKGKIIGFALWLSKQGYDEDVVKWRSDRVAKLAQLGANIWDPETVKEVLARQKSWNDGYKMLITYAYENFLEMEGLSWKRPHYVQPERLPFVPTEAELDQLIASCGKKLSVFLQGLKDTGADPGELAALEPTDINAENRTVQIRPVKRHNPRVLKVSREFINRLQTLKSYQMSQRIFNQGILSTCLNSQRKRAAQKFGNPRLQKISFTTFRHWKGTMEYHRTKDILHVMKLLGHKQIRNTLKYIHLEAMLFSEINDQYVAKVAYNTKEACALVEVGFEYITGEFDDGGKIFRKLKDYMDKAQNDGDKPL